MSEKLVYSIKDIKVGTYNPPFYMEHVNQAIRTITSVVNDKSTQLGQYPEDFELWHIGEFDDQTANFNQGPKTMVCTAISCVRRDVQADTVIPQQSLNKKQLDNHDRP